ncbi:DUF3014 domain-containing protein [Methylobacter sp. G7]|uniref:DUF3014 domain-containing protein n=1 Tax=Methylobacter sp. G7 TaxID=3230117 RepID=UPI003D803AD3
MNRYQQVNDKKSGRSVIPVVIILITLAGVARFYTEYQQHSAVSGAKTQALELPLVTDAIDPLADGASIIDEMTTTEAGIDNIEAGIDNIIELQQDNLFVLPDLEHSDALLRQEIEGISPAFSEWLNVDQLIRKYVVMANDFSQELRLEKHLRFLKLEQPFTVDPNNESSFIAMKSYRRYDRLAAAINGMDVQATLTVYKKFRPLLLQVFSEFSYPVEYRLDDILTKAAAVILAAPVMDGKIAVVKHAVNYKFADPQLEVLSPIHKQMLRMGPENTRIIQHKLRSLVEGLVNLKE